VTDPVRVRASSLADLLDCPARWKARHLTGAGEKWTSGPAALGTAIHAGTAAYDQATLEGGPISVDDAVGVSLDALRHPELEVRYDETLSKPEAINLAASLTYRYIDVIVPQVVYEAVELKCDPMTLSFNNGVRIELTGSVDRVRAVGDKRGVSDLKTGRNIVKDGEVRIDKHVAQLAIYELLELMAKDTAGIDATLPAQVIALPTNADAQPATAEVDRPSRILYGDATRPGLLEVVANMIKTDSFTGNPRSVLCSAKFCPAFKSCWWRGNFS
jgi:hypothetical protein